MKINKKLLMAALASAVIVSAPQAKTYADTQIDDTKAVTEKLIDDQLTKAAESVADTKEEIVAETQDNSELKSAKKVTVEAKTEELTSKSQALLHPVQATAVSNVENEADNSGLEISDVNVEEAVRKEAFKLNKPIPVGVYDPKNLTDEEIVNVKKAVVEANPDLKNTTINVSKFGEVTFTDPDGNEQTIDSADIVVKDYSKDEAKIEDYDEKNDYKKTDLEQGDTSQILTKDDAGKEAKDGFKFETSNPSPTSPSLTEYGYAIVIDKETGQRTYTLLYVTDTGRIAVKTGDKPMMEAGDKLTKDSPDVTFKPNEDGKVTAGGPQRNYEWVASEETLKHINDSGYTVIGMKDDYTQNNPGIKYFDGNSFTVVYKVNPWPNENDKLELMELSGEYRDKVFVQGQDIDTGIKIDNMDENAKERIVGQVYNPINGKIVPGASAYIADDGNVHIKMPEGALKKDENGKYVVNEDSIFNTEDYKALQNFDVKFFARPRTKNEFTTIADDPYDPGTYVGTDAGSGVINHKGEDVTIDKQGIDRYDHYNLIGTLKIDLDDTRYYNQNFKDGNQDDTSDITSSAVKPGEEFHVGIYEKDETDEFEKSADDMNGAKSRGEAVGVLKMDFIDKLNEGKAEEDQWKVIVDPNDITQFSIIAPRSAKAGDFAAIPVEYTYTNGSKDVHWFHFVVQETDNNLPSYHVQVDYPSIEMNSEVTVEQNDKKNKPNKYTIESDTYTDDKGNTWNVSINEETGEVTAKPQAKPDGETFNGGEKLQVPVTVHYENTDETETAFAEFVLKEKSNIEPDYDAKVGKAGDKLESNVIVNDNNYDRKPVKYTIDQTEYKDNKGNTWTVSIDENTGKVTATVPNAVDGESINLDGTMISVPVTAHYEDADGNEIGTKKANVQFLGSGTEGTHEYTEEIPFDTTIEYDPDFYTNYPDAENNYKVVTEGEVGSKTTKLTIKDSVVVKKEEVKKTDPKNAVIKVGDKNYTGVVTHTEKVEVPFTVEYRYNPELKEGEMKTVREGTNGSYNLNYSQKIKNGQADGEAETSKTDEVAPVNKIIEIGSKPASDTITIIKGVEYELDYSRKDGEPEVVEEGNDGVITIKTTRNPDTGEITITQEVTTEMKNKKIKIPAGTEGKHEYTEKIPFKYEIEYDENLKSGEYVIDVAGSEGSKTTTWNIKNSKVDGEPTVDIKDPVNAKIRVGKKDFTGEIKHTEHFEIPFEVEVRYNKDLPAGKTNEIQKGVKGSYDVEYTQKIKNGSADGEMTKEESNKVEAKKHIIEVGTKVETPENNYSKEVEVEVEYVYDDTKDKGVVETGEFTPGKVETKVVDKYNPETGKVEQTTEEVVTKAKQKVIVGTKDFTGKYEYKKTCPIPFDVEIKEDPTLKNGEKVVEQEGKPGSKTTSYEQNIKNGKPDGEAKKISEEITEQPTKHIIRIGTGETEGEVTKTIEREIPYETKVIYDETLEAGFQEIEKEGKPGKEKVTITTKIVDGKLVTTETKETITEKEDRVVRIGVKPVVKETELGHDTEYRYNPNLKEGEQNVIEEGTNGKVEYTITFNKETGKIEVSEKRTEPKNKIVEIGYKTDGKVKVESEIPFEVEIIEDPEMEAGKTEVVQEGKLGKKETIVTIENSKEVSREENIIEKPVKKIIKVGTKNVCELPPVNPDKPGKPGDKDPGTPDKPGDKDPENPDKPGDKDPENPDKPGDKDPETPGKPGDKDPGTPGEDPKDPEQPGEDQKDPEQPGGKDPKDPETPGKTPENNGKTPENNGKTPENNGKTPGATGQVDGKSTTTNNKTPKRLPKSGSESEIMTLAMSGLLTAAGFVGLKKKRKDR